MSDCPTCHQPPCICRCAYWDRDFADVMPQSAVPTAWEWTMAYLQHAQAMQAALLPVGRRATASYSLAEQA